MVEPRTVYNSSVKHVTTQEGTVMLLTQQTYHILTKGWAGLGAWHFVSMSNIKLLKHGLNSLTSTEKV